MIGWRLVKSRYAHTPLSTTGAFEFGGRWNLPGVPILYCSEHLSLAALETLVHLAPEWRYTHYVAYEIHVPDDAPLTRWEAADLPEGWRSAGGSAECAERGTQWSRTGGSLALSVPSAVVPQERNLLLNALHPDFRGVRVLNGTPFDFDLRITSPRPGRRLPSRRQSPRTAGARRR